MLFISKTDCAADISILARLSAYQECLVTFKSMTQQVVQRAGHYKDVRASLGVKRLLLWVLNILLCISYLETECFDDCFNILQIYKANKIMHSHSDSVMRKIFVTQWRIWSRGSPVPIHTPG